MRHVFSPNFIIVLPVFDIFLTYDLAKPPYTKPVRGKIKFSSRVWSKVGLDCGIVRVLQESV
jgi:hypothetical protein